VCHSGILVYLLQGAQVLVCVVHCLSGSGVLAYYNVLQGQFQLLLVYDAFLAPVAQPGSTRVD
jgi:hypothetical protein